MVGVPFSPPTTQGQHFDGCLPSGVGCSPGQTYCWWYLDPTKGQTTYKLLLELRAVHLAWKAFLPLLHSLHIQIMTDSNAAVVCINKQGGVRSRLLFQGPADFVTGASGTESRYRLRSFLVFTTPWQIKQKLLYGPWPGDSRHVIKRPLLWAFLRQ